MGKRLYVGVRGKERTVFWSGTEPTKASHGDMYAYTIGPFRHVRAARYVRDHPLCQTVCEAERLALQDEAGKCVAKILGR